MTKYLQFAVGLVLTMALLGWWLWGFARMIRGTFRSRGNNEPGRIYSERQMLGGTVRTARSGPMFSASWAPNTGPAYLFTALMYAIGYSVFTFIGFFPS